MFSDFVPQIARHRNPLRKVGNKPRSVYGCLSLSGALSKTWVGVGAPKQSPVTSVSRGDGDKHLVHAKVARILWAEFFKGGTQAGKELQEPA